MDLVGNFGNRPRENVILPRTFIPTVIKSEQEKQIMAVWDSCITKSIISGCAGKISIGKI